MLKKLLGKFVQGVKQFLGFQMLVPFDVVFAFYFIYGGLAGILKLGIINDRFVTVLGETLSFWFNVGYFLAGLAVFFGVGLKNKPVQVFGLVLVSTSLFIRILAIGWLSGIDTIVINLYVINMALILSCIARIYTLFRYEFFVSIITKQKGKIVVGVIGDNANVTDARN